VGTARKHKVSPLRSLRFAPVEMTVLFELSNFSSDQPQGIGGIYVALAVLRGNALFSRQRHISLAWSQEQIILQALLFGVEIEVSALQGIQLFVSAALDDLTMFDYQNLVGAADRR
jgi:hypothetical protein